MTLRELCNNVVLDCETVDICVWNDDMIEPVYVLGFCDCDDLGDVVAHFNSARYSHYFKPGEEKYFDYEVTYIESYTNCGKSVLRIEIYGEEIK